MSERTYRAGVVGLGIVAVGRSMMDPPPPPFGREVMNRHVYTLSNLPNVDLVAVCDHNAAGPRALQGTVGEGPPGRKDLHRSR